VPSSSSERIEPNATAEAGSDPGPPYAVVVVRTDLTRRVTSLEQVVDSEDEEYLTRAFHYHIPESLRGKLQPGHLVWVPFGPRILQGVIVALDERSPVEKTRPVEQLADPEPVLPDTHLRLARWIAEYYLAPLHRVLEAMLPPGVTQDVDIVVTAAEGTELDAPTPEQAALLDLLRKEGPYTYRELARTRLKGWRRVVDQLAAREAVIRSYTARPPAVQPKRIPSVRLAPDFEDKEHPPERATAQRRALAYFLARQDDEWVPLADAAKEADVSTATLRALADREILELSERQVWRDPLAGRAFVPVLPPRLTPEQEAVWQRIREDLESPQGRPFLLQGVTGSGKTEIYLRAVRHVLSQGRSAIVLVPEIALTPQTVRRFGARFPSTLAVLHSRLSPGERYDQWRRIRAGELRVVVGSRSAIYAPLRRLGLVVLDEEHEWTYKQQQTPRYHAREVAVELSRLAGATCLLGSATPSLESAYRAERGEYVRLDMPRRIMGHRRHVEEQASRLRVTQERFRAEPHTEEAVYAELPPVEVVDMRAELRAGNTGIFSEVLRRAIDTTLAVGQQVILFLNRRGAATFVMCRDCGYVAKCRRCDLPFTYHASQESLICHHCNERSPVPTRCPVCQSTRIRYFGAGTERVEQVVRQSYPSARVIRWDLDTTGGKTSHEDILDAFVAGRADVMIGTQMIAKGLDLPKVTLVGVVSADTILNLPDFRAGERTFQLLTQVAGRAGRSVLGGRVIVQTYAPEHPAIVAAAKHDADLFYRGEMAFRREHWYPPLSRLVKLVHLNPSAERAEEEAHRMHELLSERLAPLGLPEVDLIGPAPAFFGRVRGRYRWQLLLRGQEPEALLRDVRLPLGWRVDVDPLDLL